MRLVACLLAGLTLVAALPVANAADDCSAARFNGAPSCVTIPSPAPLHQYFVYFDWVECPMNSVCQGQPAARFLGVIWEDTNGQSGLQRRAGNPGAPDTAILW